MNKVSVITVNYNQPETTLQFLYSVKKVTRYPNFEILVIDNGSTPDPTFWLSQEFPDAKFLRSETNLGFAGGNNIGIAESTGEYLFFVNNDTEFTEDIISTLAGVLDREQMVGLISPKIVYFDKPEIIQYAGFSPMNYATGRNKCLGQFETDRGQHDQRSGPTSYAHGAAMMVRRQVVLEAGPMPENYFLYYEEMDWCESIKRQGYRIWFEPKAVIQHKESISVGRTSALKEYFMTRNRILFIRRNAPLVSSILFTLYFCVFVMPRNLLKYIISNRPDLARAFFKAAWWNLRHKKK